MSILINVDKDYGVLRKGLSFEFQEGYNVILGKNNTGKSAVTQYTFRSVLLHYSNLYNQNNSVLITTNRSHQSLTAQPGSKSLGEFNARIRELIHHEPMGYEDLERTDSKQLSCLILNGTDGLLNNVNNHNYLIEKLGFKPYKLIDQQKITFGSDQMSVTVQGSGLRSIFSILAALAADSIKLIIIDEPEIALEPKLQKMLRDLFYEYCSKKTIIISTHSHLFLNRKEPDKNFEIINSTGRVSNINKLGSEELFNKTFSLLGSSLDDLFFPENFIFVEGASDQVILERCLKILDKHTLIKVVSSESITNTSNRIHALVDILVPFVTKDSPYKKRVIVLVDKRNTSTASHIVEIENCMSKYGNFFELEEEDILFAIPENIYLEAGRDKASDIQEINSLKGDYKKLCQLKLQISNQLKEKIDNLNKVEQITTVHSAIKKAIDNIDPA